MTQREFFKVIANGSGNISYKNENGNLNYKDITIDAPEIKEFAKAAIAKLNADAEKRKAKVNEENTAFYAELGEKIINSVEVGKAYSAKEIASLIEEKAGKVVYALRGLADTGRIEKFKEKKSDSYSYRYNG